MLQNYIYLPNFIGFLTASELVSSSLAGAEIMSARTFISERF